MRFVLALVLLFGGCSKTEPPAPPPAVSSSAVSSSAKDPAAARTLIERGAIVIDVRTAEEFAEEHLPNAVNIPVGEVKGRLAEVERLVGGDRGKPVVVYCGSGRRSAKAKDTLDAAGFSQVVNGGGLDDLR